MQPSPLSSNHPADVSYQAALQEIEEHLFAHDEELELNHEIDASGHVNQFAELIGRPAATREGAQAAGDTSPSDNAFHTISAIRAFFFAKNIPDCASLHFATVKKRLASINLIPASLLATLTILDTPNHPMLREENISKHECQSMILLLSDITNTRGRLSHTIRTAADHGQNDPHLFISRLVTLVRMQS